jgi:hypothetical protein
MNHIHNHNQNHYHNHRQFFKKKKNSSQKSSYVTWVTIGIRHYKCYRLLLYIGELIGKKTGEMVRNLHFPI